MVTEKITIESYRKQMHGIVCDVYLWETITDPQTGHQRLARIKCTTITLENLKRALKPFFGDLQ